MEATLDYGVTRTPVNEVEEARKRAQDALRRATGPMHVPQPDGSTARRCYVGRLSLAYARMDDPAYADRRADVLAAIVELSEAAQAAWEAYKAALRDYLRLGGKEAVVERECRCEVCAAYEPPTVRLVDAVAAG